MTLSEIKSIGFAENVLKVVEILQKKTMQKSRLNGSLPSGDHAFLLGFYYREHRPICADSV
jgi:hypothetical protein